MLIAIALVLALGSYLAVVGIRGVRVDDHPLCRRCRFDLTGRPVDAEPRCPECGGHLTSPRAIVIGHRRRRRGPLLVGLLLILASTGSLGWAGWEAARHVDWITIEPMWALLRQAASADPKWRGPALQEVSRRSRGPGWGVTDWDRVADAATAYLADPAKPTDALWSSLFDPAYTNGRPSPSHWQPYVEELARQAAMPTPGRQSTAMDELTHRLADTPVDDATRRRIVAIGLDYQGDLARPWVTGWAEMIERARAAGLVTDDQWHRYADQAMTTAAFGFRLRPRVRRGDPLPYWLDENGGRGPAYSSALHFRVTHLQVHWDGQPKPFDVGLSPGGSLGSNGGASGSTFQPREFPPALPDGVQHLHLTGTVAVRESPKKPSDTGEDAPPLLTRTLDLPATFELLPADQPTVTVDHDATKADAIRRSLKVESVEQQAGSYAYVHVTISANGPPTGLAFRVTLVQAGLSLDAGSFSCPAGVRNHSYGTGAQGRLAGDRADVILRGDPAMAAATVDCTSAWDGTITFKDVPVVHR